MTDDEKNAALVYTQSNPTVFICAMFFVLDREHVGVKEDLRSSLKTDLMIA
jgi:hypothetical protein